MTLSDYAKKLGIQYRTAWNHFKEGKIAGAYKLESGTIIVPSDKERLKTKLALYARVSSSENKTNLDSQLIRIRNWAVSNGYTINYEVSEVGSGLNDNRKSY